MGQRMPHSWRAGRCELCNVALSKEEHEKGCYTKHPASDAFDAYWVTINDGENPHRDPYGLSKCDARHVFYAGWDAHLKGGTLRNL